METRIKCEDLSCLSSIAESLLSAYPEERIFAIEGEMGAGKTTFIKALVKELESKDQVSSPSFALVNEYEHPSGSIYHFDLYRLEKRDELQEIGFTEYVDSGEYCFIEWPEMAIPLIGQVYVHVTIERSDHMSERLFSWILSQ